MGRLHELVQVKIEPTEASLPALLLTDNALNKHSHGRNSSYDVRTLMQVTPFKADHTL